MKAIGAEAVALPDRKLHKIHARDNLKTRELHYLVNLEGNEAQHSILACIPAAADARNPHLMLRTPSTLRGQSSSKMSYSRRNRRIVPTFSQRDQPQKGKALAHVLRLAMECRAE